MKEDEDWRQVREHLEEYTRAQVLLFKLGLTERSAKIGSSIISSLLVYIALLMGLVFLTVALALFIGELTGHNSIGFLSMGGFCILVFILLKTGRKKYKEKLTNQIINLLHEDDEE